MLVWPGCRVHDHDTVDENEYLKGTLSARERMGAVAGFALALVRGPPGLRNLMGAALLLLLVCLVVVETVV